MFHAPARVAASSESSQLKVASFCRALATRMQGSCRVDRLGLDTGQADRLKLLRAPDRAHANRIGAQCRDAAMLRLALRRRLYATGVLSTPMPRLVQLCGLNFAWAVLSSPPLHAGATAPSLTLLFQRWLGWW